MGKSAAAAALYQCSECGWKSPRWAGRCGECQQWGTLSESKSPAPNRLRAPARGGRLVLPATAAVPIAETIRGFEEIIDGKHDEVPESAFFLKGTIDEVVEAAKK